MRNDDDSTTEQIFEQWEELESRVNRDRMQRLLYKWNDDGSYTLGLDYATNTDPNADNDHEIDDDPGTAAGIVQAKRQLIRNMFVAILAECDRCIHIGESEVDRIVEFASQGLGLLDSDTLPAYVCKHCHGSGRAVVQGREER